jgi:hypothetical protein
MEWDNIGHLRWRVGVRLRQSVAPRETDRRSLAGQAHDKEGRDGVGHSRERVRGMAPPVVHMQGNGGAPPVEPMTGREGIPFVLVARDPPVARMVRKGLCNILGLRTNAG